MILNQLHFKHFIRQIIFISTLMLLVSVCNAGIYKWVDDEGNVHYSQQRPANTSSERMKVQQYAPKDTSSYKRPSFKSSDTQTAKSPKAEEDEPEEEKETRAEKKQRMADCEQIRNNLASMESRGRIRSKDADGNITYLSDKEKQARITKSKATLSKSCK